jgi:hypothetical protein
MGAMALLSLAVGLRTVSFRRSRDQEPLGYLPDDTNVIVAVHASKALQTATGQEVLNQFRFGPTDMGLVSLEQWLGLSLDQDVGDLVFGLRVDDRFPPRVILVVQTRRPYDEAKVRAALKDSQYVERRQKKLYQFRSEKTPFKPAMWCAAPSTLVIGLEPEQLDAVPLTPHSGIEHLARPIQEFLQDPNSTKAQTWGVAHADHWDRTILGPLAAASDGKTLETLKAVQTLGVWLHFDQAVSLKVAGRCADGAEPLMLEQFFRRWRVLDSGHFQMEGDQRVSVEAQVDPERLVEWLKMRW